MPADYRRANMYVKRHAVRHGDKHYVYLRLVQAYRADDGRVRHRVLTTLGREEHGMGGKAFGYWDGTTVDYRRG